MSMAFLFDFGKSRTWPTEARTVKAPSRYFSMVFALLGDSTINNFIIIFFPHVPSSKYYTKDNFFANLKQIL